MKNKNDKAIGTNTAITQIIDKEVKLYIYSKCSKKLERLNMSYEIH